MVNAEAACSNTAMTGFLNITKPAGWTSRDVVNKVQRLVRPLKTGHAGTLDPLATGVLIVAVGAATRLISYAQGHEKIYRASFQLGLTSDTDDATGNITHVTELVSVTREQIEETLSGFVGTISQVPPQFSAIHVDGQRAYDLARSGQSVDLKARQIEVHQIRLERFEGDQFDCWIRCGSGTYIRSIGRDLGIALGCGAIMTKLERLAIGPCHVDSAIDVETLTRENIHESLINPLTLLSSLPQLELSSEQVVHLEQGRKLPCFQISPSLDQCEVVLIDGTRLAGIAVWHASMQVLQPKIVFKRNEKV